MTIHAIDPGPVKSAMVSLYDDGRVEHELDINAEIIASVCCEAGRPMSSLLVIEQVTSFGMPVGAEVFETVYWSGRFAQAWVGHSGDEAHRIPRLAVKATLCHDSRAKDANIRQALIDRFGGPSCIRKGGALYKVHGDEWAALAVAVTFREQQKQALAAVGART